jgi:hypothetical protein
MLNPLMSASIVGFRKPVRVGIRPAQEVEAHPDVEVPRHFGGAAQGEPVEPAPLQRLPVLLYTVPDGADEGPGHGVHPRELERLSPGKIRGVCPAVGGPALDDAARGIERVERKSRREFGSPVVPDPHRKTSLCRGDGIDEPDVVQARLVVAEGTLIAQVGRRILEGEVPQPEGELAHFRLRDAGGVPVDGRIVVEEAHARGPHGH